MRSIKLQPCTGAAYTSLPVPDGLACAKAALKLRVLPSDGKLPGIIGTATGYGYSDGRRGHRNPRQPE